MKLILAAKTSKKFTNNKGFSLIEIMVTLMLVVTMLTLLPISTDKQDLEKIEESINTLNRVTRFSVNESILRNVLIRIKFDLESSPTEYSIEHGNGPEVILPTAVDIDKLSYSEREAYEKKTSKFDNQFTPITEFTDGPQTLPEGIEIYGIGTTYNPKLMTDGKVSIYFYPTGEKDSALLIFNTEYSMGTLSLSPFEDRTFHQIIQFTDEQIDNLDISLEEKTKEEFEKWLKD